jgi:hypothetical protein
MPEANNEDCGFIYLISNLVLAYDQSPYFAWQISLDRSSDPRVICQFQSSRSKCSNRRQCSGRIDRNEKIADSGEIR